MVENEQDGHEPASQGDVTPHRHRRRRKHRSLRYRLVRATLVILFFGAWCVGFKLVADYLAKKEELGKNKMYDVDPAGFDASLKSKY